MEKENTFCSNHNELKDSYNIQAIEYLVGPLSAEDKTLLLVFIQGIQFINKTTIFTIWQNQSSTYKIIPNSAEVSNSIALYFEQAGIPYLAHSAKCPDNLIKNTTSKLRIDNFFHPICTKNHQVSNIRINQRSEPFCLAKAAKRGNLEDILGECLTSPSSQYPSASLLGKKANDKSSQL